MKMLVHVGNIPYIYIYIHIIHRLHKSMTGIPVIIDLKGLIKAVVDPLRVFFDLLL